MIIKTDTEETKCAPDCYFIIFMLTMSFKDSDFK